MKQLAPRNSAPESPPTRDTPHHHHHDHDIIVHGDRPPDPIKLISKAPFPEKMWQVCMFDINLVRKCFVSSFPNPNRLGYFRSSNAGGGGGGGDHGPPSDLGPLSCGGH